MDYVWDSGSLPPVARFYIISSYSVYTSLPKIIVLNNCLEYKMKNVSASVCNYFIKKLSCAKIKSMQDRVLTYSIFCCMKHLRQTTCRERLGLLAAEVWSTVTWPCCL